MREFLQNFSAFTRVISFITAGPNLAREGQAREERGGNMIGGELKVWLRERKGWYGREGEARSGKGRLKKGKK